MNRPIPRRRILLVYAGAKRAELVAILQTKLARMESDRHRSAFCFPPITLAVAGETLSFSELAIAKAFLEKSPHVRTEDSPELIASGGSLAYGLLADDWFRGLSEDSLAKLALRYPFLSKRIQEGRSFRLSYIDRFLALTDDYFQSQEGFDPNIAARLRRSYLSLLQKYRSSAKRKSQLEAEIQAERQTRVRYLYPDSLQQRDWDAEATRYFRKQRDWLAQEETPNKQSVELPTKIFQNWRNTEIARLRKLADKGYGYIWVTPPELEAAPAAHRRYIYAIGAEKVDHARDNLRLLRKTVSPSQQKFLLNELTRNQIEEDHLRDAIIRREFGESGAWTGGLQTKLHTPRDQWLLDLGWWGLSQGQDYWEKRQGNVCLGPPQ